MASHQLIDAYVRELDGRLPADAVDEIADGLHEAWRHHLDRGVAPADAAQAAIAEFGTPTLIARAFVVNAAGRRAARLLLATSPIIGISWGSGLLAAHVWTWPIPAAVAGVFAVTLLAVVGCLVTAATSRNDYRRTRLGHVGAAGLVVLDTAMIAAVLLAAPTLIWPMAMGVAGSLVRMGITLRHAHRLLGA
jgi:FtsH-binding integral membrane protein